MNNYLGGVVVADQDHHFAVVRAEGFGHVGGDELDIGVAFGGFLGEMAVRRLRYGWLELESTSSLRRRVSSFFQEPWITLTWTMSRTSSSNASLDAP